MKTQKIPIRVFIVSLRMMVLGIVGLTMTPGSRAGIVGNYPVDGNTLHLWHFDETNSTGVAAPLFAYDAISNQNNGLAGFNGGITLSNVPGPDILAPTEFATNGQPGYAAYTNGSLNVTYNYCILLTNGSCYYSPFTNVSGSGYQSTLYTNICNYEDTNTGAFTWEVLVNLNYNPFVEFGGETRQYITCGDNAQKVSSNRGWFWDISDAGQFEFYNVSSPNAQDLKETLPSSGPDAAYPGQWYHMAVTYSGWAPTNGDTPNVLNMYWTLMDPARTSCDLLASITNSITNGIEGETPFLGIGGNGRGNFDTSVTDSGGFDGFLDELRISNVRRGASQMAFNSANVQEPPSFADFATNVVVPFGGMLNVDPLEWGSQPMTNQWYQIVNGATNAVAGQTNQDLAIPNANPAQTPGTYFLVAANAYGSITSVLVTVAINTANFDGLYPTAVDNNDNPLDVTAPGSFDPHWTIPIDPDLSASGSNAVIWSTNLPSTGGYEADSPPAGGPWWIGPEQNAGTVQGTYEYQTTFVLDQGSTNSATLSGVLLSAGAELGPSGIVTFSLNGVPTTVPNGTYSGGVNPVDFVITNGFQPGSNTLDISLPNVSPNGGDAYGMVVYDLVGNSIAYTNAPVVTNQPSNVTVNYGATASFTVVAFGAPLLSYEWLTNGTAKNSGGKAIDSFTTTNRTYTFVATNFPLSAIKNGFYTNNYYVIVTNGLGAATSAVAELTVDCLPYISRELPVPYTNLFTLYAGVNPVFSLAPGGPPPVTYQWFTNGVAAGGGTNSAFTWTNVQAGIITNYCVLSNPYGSITSEVWTAQVIADPAAPYPTNVLALNPIAYWRLNDTNLDGVDNGGPGGSGNNGGGDDDWVANDYAGGNNGLYTNVSLGNPGYNPISDPSETSVEFGETGIAYTYSLAGWINGVDFAAPSGSNGEFTVEAWANNISGAPAGGAPVAAEGTVGADQFALDVDTSASKNYRFYVRNAAGTVYTADSSVSSTTEALDEWVHLAGVCDESNGRILLYINGQLAASASIPTNSGVYEPNSPMEIGDEAPLGTYQFYGYINDVSAFNYPLSSNQVANEYFSSGIAPVITQQPVASTNVDHNGTLTVSAAASGTPPLFYSWYDEGAGGYIAGQTNSTLVLSNVSAADTYYLTVTNIYGSTNSNPVQVGMIFGLNVSLGPPNLELYVGQSIALTAQASGNAPLNYQWYQNGSTIHGATASSYTATAASGNVSYTCTVTNNYNGYSSTNAGPVVVTGIADPTTRYQLTVLSNNPIAYWRLDEGPDNGSGNDGTVAYDSAGGHNAIYTNVELDLTGFSTNGVDSTDTAALFGEYNSSPSNSYVSEINNSSNEISPINFAEPAGRNGEFSVEAWVCSSNTQALGAGIAAKGWGDGDEQFDLDVYNGFRFFMRDASGTYHGVNLSAAPTVGQWYYLVGVFDGANGAVHLYTNGVDALDASNIAPSLGVLTTTTTNSLLPQTAFVSIGARASGQAVTNYDFQFQGKIQDVALYNYALSAAQVAVHYQASGLAVAPINPNPTNLVFGVTNNQLYLTWPADHTGWQLQAQTNNLSVGISTNWVNVGGSSGTNQVIVPINLTNGGVFYRLVY